MIYVLGGTSKTTMIDTVLNYKVVGGTSAPSSPVGNTIWINTSNAITFYTFQPLTPSNPQEGWVWINVAPSYSPVAFNALKENRIQLYPISAKQYISGAWVNKTAKTYQSGTWKDWVIYLYNTGDKCESVHGGWTTSTRWHATNAKTPYITYNEDTMLVGVTGSGKNFQSGILETVDGVDLTNYSKLTFVVTKTEASQAFDDGWVRVYIGTTANLSGNVTANVEKYIDRPGTYTLDISSLSGVHDIIVKVVCAGNTSSYTRVTFSQIYLSN